MKKRPKITTASSSSPEGVKRTSTQLTYESKSGNIYKGKKVETTSITSDTPNAAARLKEISPIGYTADDQLRKMEKVAKICLEEAGIPTEIQETYDPISKLTEQKTPMFLAEEKYGKYSDEYYAGKTLLHIAVVRNENNGVDTRISSVITAADCFHEFTLDTHAYLAGKKLTKPKKSDVWLKMSYEILDENGWTIDDLTSRPGKISFRMLANLVAVRADKLGGSIDEMDNEDNIRRFLSKYFMNLKK
jgi:hypothetical protein